MIKTIHKTFNIILLIIIVGLAYLFYQTFFSYETFKITSVNQEHIIVSKNPKSSRTAITIKVDGHFRGRANLYLSALTKDSTLGGETQVLYSFLGDLDTTFTMDFYESIPVLRFEPTPAIDGYLILGIR